MTILDDIIAAIYRFVGGPMSRADLEAKLEAKAREHSEAHAEELDWRHSIVDLLKLTGQDSSMAARDKLAAELGYEGAYNGGAQQNIWLLEQVMKKLERE